jgi:hypothetical protein
VVCCGLGDKGAFAAAVTRRTYAAGSSQRVAPVYFRLDLPSARQLPHCEKSEEFIWASRLREMASFFGYAV